MRSLLVQRLAATRHEAPRSSGARIALGTLVCLSLFGCGSSSSGNGQQDEQGDGAVGRSSQAELDDAGAGSNPGDDGGNPGANEPSEGGGVASDGGTAGPNGGFPKGWLYTNGAQIYVSNGNGGTPWMGRGVNMNDIFLCGYNNTLSMASPDTALKQVVSGMISAWKPSLVRMSLGMDSYPTVASWLTNDAQYKTPMTSVINAIGANPNVYVLVTLRSDASMILEDTADGDPEATGIPSDSKTTPSASKYPTGTDATYVALVDTFANSNFVMFGITNEAGGNTASAATISAAMDHAVGTIRAEEDRLGVPHHIVSVQGNDWTSDISFYAKTPSPITHDNVVYEVHGYPPPAKSYTYPSIPVIIGEYGTLTSTTAATFYADVEQKQIPNIAWDFDSFSGCAPDLLTVNKSSTNLVPTAWGKIVQAYLLAHVTP